MENYKTKFSRQRSQAKRMNEVWELTYEEWSEIWDDRQHLGGNSIDDLTFCRIDRSKPWSKDNVHVVTVRERLDSYKRGSKKRIKVCPYCKGDL